MVDMSAQTMQCLALDYSVVASLTCGKGKLALEDFLPEFQPLVPSCLGKRFYCTSEGNKKKREKEKEKDASRMLFGNYDRVQTW